MNGKKKNMSMHMVIATESIQGTDVSLQLISDQLNSTVRTTVHSMSCWGPLRWSQGECAGSDMLYIDWGDLSVCKSGC